MVGVTLCRELSPLNNTNVPSFIWRVFTGVLSFNTAPDYENPSDNGSDNSYSIVVTVTDNSSQQLTDTQSLTIIVKDLDELLPKISSITSTSPDSLYKVGDNISITLLFSEPVALTANGIVYLTLETGTTDQTLGVSSLSTDSTATFTYTVMIGETVDSWKMRTSAPILKCFEPKCWNPWPFALKHLTSKSK